MTSVFLNLLICFVAYHMIYSRECSMCILEECIFCCCWLECLYKSIKFICAKVWFSWNVSFMIFCLDDLFTDDSGVLKSPKVIILSFSPLKFVIIVSSLYHGINQLWIKNIWNKCYFVASIYYVVRLIMVASVLNVYRSFFFYFLNNTV